MAQPNQNNEDEKQKPSNPPPFFSQHELSMIMKVVDDNVNPWTDDPLEKLPTYEEAEKAANEAVEEQKHDKKSKVYEENINDYKPTCPVIFFEQTLDAKQPKQIFTIHCEKLDVVINCFVNTAIITMKGQWTNRTKYTLDCVFALPTPGIVSNITVHIGSNRVITTAILPHEDTYSLIKKAKQIFNKLFKRDQTNESDTHITPEDTNPYEQYVPGLFRFPFNGVAPTETISIECQYVEELDYYKKGYIVSVPLYFPPGTMIESTRWDKVVTVQCKINSLAASSKIDCWTHHIKTTNNNDNGSIIVQTGAIKPIAIKDKSDDLSISKTGRDFELSYSVTSEKTQMHCIRQVDIDDPTSGSLCVFITPPTTLNTTFGRAFFFLIDRSGSMVGEPFREVLRALKRALDRLRPSDQFNVCVFDHRQVYYQPSLVPANNEMLTNCKTWITTYVPERGGTTLDLPINEALQHLEKSDLLPFIVIVTDGAVHNEREICDKIESNKKMRTRFLTLGVGSYCNRFFLQMLSKLGRGFSDIVIYRERIYHKMDHLLRMANTPVLTDIEVGLKSDEIELYPFPIQDLFIGAPVIVKVRYNNNICPSKLLVRGFNPHGDQERIKCNIVTRNDIPIHLINCLTQCRLLTADAWLRKSKKLERRVCEFSTTYNIPSMFTSLIGMETSNNIYEGEQKMINDIMKEGNTETTGDTVWRRHELLAKIKNTKKYVSAMVIGVAVVATSASTGQQKGGLGLFPKDGNAGNNNPFRGLELDFPYYLDKNDCNEIGDAFEDALEDLGEWTQQLVQQGELFVQQIASGVNSYGDVQATLDNIPILGGGGDLDIDLDACCEGDCDCDCDCWDVDVDI